MTRRIYVAAHLAAVDQAAAAATLLRRAGHLTTSTWHETREDAHADKDRAQRQAICAKNHRDLAQADTILALAHPDCRGTLVELATAYFRGHEVCVVGSPFGLTLMLDLPDVRWFADLHAAREHLRRARARAA